LHKPDLPEGLRAWKHIWSGGHSTGLIDAVPSVADLVGRLGQEFAAARHPGDCRAALARILT
jgi:nitronate monooxygenase